MIKRLGEFFEEDNGRLSNVRLNATALVMTACFIAVYSVMFHKLDANIITMVSLLAGLGLGGKVLQKTQEEPVKTGGTA